MMDELAAASVKKTALLHILKYRSQGAMTLSRTAYDEPQSQRAYRLPSIDLLAQEKPQRHAPKPEEDIAAKLDTMFRQLEVDAHVSAFHRGPAVTRYEVTIGPGVTINDIWDHRSTIFYTAATTKLRLFSPIPGKSALSIEIPNADPELVRLGDVLRSGEMASDVSPTLIPLGVDFEERIVTTDLMALPHLLIGGMKDTGKSSFINAMLATILMRATPNQVRILLIDTTRIELSAYAGIHRLPHLLTPLITDPQKAAQALEWVTKEIDARYEDRCQSKRFRTRILDGQVQAPSDTTPRKVSIHPTLIVIVNDPAGLLLGTGNGADDAVRRIAQLGAVSDVHLVLSTIPPYSSNVISAVAKANCPARLSFAMHSGFDSRTNLDYCGAESLIGKGDALFTPTRLTFPVRIQTPWIDETEIRKVITHVRKQPRPPYPTADAFLKTL